MKKMRILLTGDDGYNSVGTRILVHVLQKEHEVCIAGTKKQQSGVGGSKSIMVQGAWGEDSVDGIRALWVDGSPVDAVECAKVFFPMSFDLVISGINLGANIGGCLLTSGTFAAAFHAVNLGLTKQALALSWDVPSHLHFKKHSSGEDVQQFIAFPGETAHLIIQEAMNNDLWGSALVNVNIPAEKTNRVRFTKPLPDVQSLWPCPVLDAKTGMFTYGYGDHATDIGGKDTDLSALTNGIISISLCQSTMIDVCAYNKIQSKDIVLTQ